MLILKIKDDHIKKVTEDYCDWVKSLGGEHNIDPTTITSLFASGYETKPPLSVPIHVVELTNIPNELRPTAYAPDQESKEQLEKNIYRDDETVCFIYFLFSCFVFFLFNYFNKLIFI
jgi:hypothetical protein